MTPKWIEFELLPQIDNKKTKIWMVRATQGGVYIGEIKWYSGWRTYAYFPIENTVYEDDCLRDIANFINEQMKARAK